MSLSEDSNDSTAVAMAANANRLGPLIASHANSGKNRAMANPDRLSGLDASFLHLERDACHMHVGSCLLFDGGPPAYGELIEHIERRLHLVPRYRQRLALVPFQQG